MNIEIERLVIRSALSQDIPGIAELMTELGYPTSSEEMLARYDQIAIHPDYRAIVAVTDKHLVGMIGLIRCHYFEKNGTYVRIAATIVKSEFRRHGIGRKLMQSAENWAAEVGANSIMLNCGNRPERAEAQLFYSGLGYQLKSSGFIKIIS
jgi:GNAT superfamily N-acetyltransferase